MLSAKKVAAGKSGQIEAKIKTDSFSGPIKKTITVATNDPRNLSVELSIKAIVEPEIAVSDSAVFFENIAAGKAAVREVILTIPESKPIKILSVASKDPSVDVRVESIPGSNGKKMRLSATQKADAKPGYHFGAILIKTTSRRTPEFAIFARGLVAAPGK